VLILERLAVFDCDGHSIEMDPGDRRPPLVGSSAPRLGAGGHARGHNCQGALHDIAPPPQDAEIRSGRRAESFRVVHEQEKVPICRRFSCRRRDSNPRHADYDSEVLWL
jgi:hypothetical protein